MKLGSLAASRPAYYDRNAVSTVVNDANTYAPHATTTRWTSTVAAGKKMLVELANATVTPQTAAATALSSFSIVRITSGAVIADMAYANVLGSAAILTATIVNTATAVTIYASETVSGITGNGNTGGTMFHFVAMKGTTYDA